MLAGKIFWKAIQFWRELVLASQKLATVLLASVTHFYFFQ